jgi:transcriptional regulator with XRE-family HTH domain
MKPQPDNQAMLQALGTNIKAARIAAGISLSTLAKLSGISKGNCSKVEHGMNVTVVSLYRICWALGVHPREVLPEYRPAAGSHLTELHNLGNDYDGWSEIRVRKDLIPDGATLVEAYLTDREIIVMGRPPEDGDHNCDAMGCGSISHVLIRIQR